MRTIPTADIRRKVASAAALCEDGFDMSFGGRSYAMQQTTNDEWMEKGEKRDLENDFENIEIAFHI